MGTSLTEGLGLARPEVEAWPARVGELADSAGFDLVIVNAGLSGETSAGALRRVEWVLRQTPDVLVLETGANDGLRGIPIAEVERNLDGILTLVAQRAPSTRLVLVAMEAPTNLGGDYTGQFRELYRNAASRHRTTLTPFLLDGVAGVTEMNQADQIHPTADGHRRMARNAWAVLDSVYTLVTPHRAAGVLP
jgi:acyl-CoA thioesterase-1